MSTTDFFGEIMKHDNITNTLDQHGFKREIYEPDRGVRTAGLKFEKDNWFLPNRENPNPLCVHYEVKYPYKICMHVHVEIYPYHENKSFGLDDPRLITRKRELDVKKSLLGDIRSRIMNDAQLRVNVYPSIFHLNPTDRPNTNAAVKFEKLGENYNPGECAVFYAHVIATVTPIIDSIVSKNRAFWYTV